MTKQEILDDIPWRMDSLTQIIIGGELPSHPRALDNLKATFESLTLSELAEVLEGFKDLGYRIHPVIQGMFTTAFACKVFNEISILPTSS